MFSLYNIFRILQYLNWLKAVMKEDTRDVTVEMKIQLSLQVLYREVFKDY